MIAPLRRLCPAVLSTIALGLVLLPPSSWSLCIGSNGHFEIEPAPRTEQLCCEAEPGRGIPDTCAPDDCENCVDLALSPGLALRSRPDDLSLQPVLAAPAMVVILSTPPPTQLTDPSADFPARPGGIRTGTIILRC